jgi:hypothetical protein
MEELSDAPDHTRVEGYLRDIRRMLDEAPAGSLSGGMAMKPSDWGPAQNEFFGDYNEIRHGLTDEEKARVMEQAELMAQGFTRQDMQAFDDAQEEDAMFEQDLWRDFQSQYPDHARDPNAVAKAVAEVSENYRQHGRNARVAAKEDRRNFLWEVSLGVEYPDMYQSDTSGSASPSDGHRTAGIGGYGGGYSGDTRRTNEPPVKDMITQIREKQRGSGFY